LNATIHGAEMPQQDFTGLARNRIWHQVTGSTFISPKGKQKKPMKKPSLIFLLALLFFLFTLLQVAKPGTRALNSQSSLATSK